MRKRFFDRLIGFGGSLGSFFVRNDSRLDLFFRTPGQSRFSEAIFKSIPMKNSLNVLSLPGIGYQYLPALFLFTKGNGTVNKLYAFYSCLGEKGANYMDSHSDSGNDPRTNKLKLVFTNEIIELEGTVKDIKSGRKIFAILEDSIAIIDFDARTCGSEDDYSLVKLCNIPYDKDRRHLIGAGNLLVVPSCDTPCNESGKKFEKANTFKIYIPGLMEFRHFYSSTKDAQIPCFRSVFENNYVVEGIEAMVTDEMDRRGFASVSFLLYDNNNNTSRISVLVIKDLDEVREFVEIEENRIGGKMLDFECKVKSMCYLLLMKVFLCVLTEDGCVTLFRLHKKKDFLKFFTYSLGNDISSPVKMCAFPQIRSGLDTFLINIISEKEKLYELSASWKNPSHYSSELPDKLRIEDLELSHALYDIKKLTEKGIEEEKERDVVKIDNDLNKNNLFIQLPGELICYIALFLRRLDGFIFISKRIFYEFKRHNFWGMVCDYRKFPRYEGNEVRMAWWWIDYHQQMKEFYERISISKFKLEYVNSGFQYGSGTYCRTDDSNLSRVGKDGNVLFIKKESDGVDNFLLTKVFLSGKASSLIQEHKKFENYPCTKQLRIKISVEGSELGGIKFGYLKKIWEKYSSNTVFGKDIKLEKKIDGFLEIIMEVETGYNPIFRFIVKSSNGGVFGKIEEKCVTYPYHRDFSFYLQLSKSGQSIRIEEFKLRRKIDSDFSEKKIRELKIWGLRKEKVKFNIETGNLEFDEVNVGKWEDYWIFENEEIYLC